MPGHDKKKKRGRPFKNKQITELSSVSVINKVDNEDVQENNKRITRTSLSSNIRVQPKRKSAGLDIMAKTISKKLEENKKQKVQEQKNSNKKSE